MCDLCNLPFYGKCGSLIVHKLVLAGSMFDMYKCCVSIFPVVNLTESKLAAAVVDHKTIIFQLYVIVLIQQCKCHPNIVLKIVEAKMMHC